eukprot:887864_1
MGNAKSLTSDRSDKDALAKFINSPAQTEDLHQLWKAFDKDNSGSIDADELQEIVFHLIIIFWEYATPKKQVPKRDQLQSVIDHICQNIMMQVDLDNNGLITRNEFDKFGEYVTNQWAACVDKVRKKNKNVSSSYVGGGSFNINFSPNLNMGISIRKSSKKN